MPKMHLTLKGVSTPTTKIEEFSIEEFSIEVDCTAEELITLTNAAVQNPETHCALLSLLRRL